MSFFIFPFPLTFELLLFSGFNGGLERPPAVSLEFLAYVER